MSKNGGEYIVMYVDLGYRTANVTFDTNLISEITNLRMAELYGLETNKPFAVGKIVLKG